MKKPSAPIIWLILICSHATICGDIGQSSIITLSFPYGARQYGMGEVGAALADDESTVFWNPAGLGIDNERWYGGAFTQFYEPLLPAFETPDLWYTAFAVCFQPKPSDVAPHFDPGGFGLFCNFLNFGEIIQYDAQGRIVGSYHGFEYVFGFGWGFNFAPIGAENLSLGLEIKYAHSALYPGIGDALEGTAQTVAFDFGTLYCFPFGMRIAFTLQNMGRYVYYISMEEADPIPFTGRFALGYKEEFVFNGFRALQICAEYNLEKEMVHNEPYEEPDPFYKAIVTSWKDDPKRDELAEIIHNAGFEATIFNSGSLRLGILHDKAGSRTECHFGLGGSWFNHFNFDWSYIYSPKKSIARDGQWGISFSFHNIFNWTDRDFKWWYSHQ